MNKQRTMRFTVERQSGQLAVNHRIEENLLNHPRDLEVPEPKRETKTDNVAQCLNHSRAQLLKRLARRAMANTTDCAPEQIGAHVAHLESLIELFDFNLRHEFSEGPESVLSATPLKPYTLAEYGYCLRWTRQQHRAPAFLSQRDEEITQINQKLDLIGACVRDLYEKSRTEGN